MLKNNNNNLKSIIISFYHERNIQEAGSALKKALGDNLRFGSALVHK